MRFTRGRFERTDIWREGKWVDLWSVVHLFSGVSTAFAAWLLISDVVLSIAIALVLFVAYEYWEIWMKIEETPQNRFMDVVVGLAGFVPAILFVTPALSQTEFILIGGLIFTTNIVLATFGWLASHKAEALEERMRLRVLRSRERFARRRLERLQRTDG